MKIYGIDPVVIQHMRVRSMLVAAAASAVIYNVPVQQVVDALCVAVRAEVWDEDIGGDPGSDLAPEPVEVDAYGGLHPVSAANAVVA